jgi:APA family basic amino acid/polyamine antiporter
LLFIGIGWQFIKPENHTPYMIPEGTAAVVDSAGKVIADYSPFNKHGWGGVLGGAAVVFFAFIGLMRYPLQRKKQRIQKEICQLVF